MLQEHQPPATRLRLLDGFALEDAPVAAMPPRTATLNRAEQRLIAFLAAHGPAARAELAGLLWPEVTERRAQACLRTALWRLRRQHPHVLGGNDPLSIRTDVAIDVTAFIAAIRDALSAGSPPPPVGSLAGPRELLPGWYDDWVLFERERLRQLQLHALEALAARLRDSARYAEAGEAALAAIGLDPLRETATRSLITVHLAENNVAEAVRRYRIFRDHLDRELGIAPSAELRRIMRSTLSDDSVARLGIATPGALTSCPAAAARHDPATPR